MVLFQFNGTVEPNMSFLTCGDAHVVILPVGQVPDAQFFQYAECIAKESEVDLHNVQPFYQERQKSPFFSLPWSNGVLRLKFHVDVNQILKQERLVASPKGKKGKRMSVFEENNILQDIKEYGHRRRTFGVIGVCSCDQCPNIAQAYEDFLQASKMYPNACALRCLLFDPSDSHVDQDHVTATSMIMVPPSKGEALGQHMETIMQDFCAVMIMGLEQLALKADACDIPSRRLSFHRLSNQDGETSPDDSHPSSTTEDAHHRRSPSSGSHSHDHDQDQQKSISSKSLSKSQSQSENNNSSSNDKNSNHGDLLDSSGAILRTAPEIARVEAFITGMANPRDDNAKRLKKRKLASVQRDIGFYCLASGSPVDGLRHFSTAIELSQGAADFKTTVAALEGYLCALLLLKQHYLKQQSMEEDSQLVWQNEELVSVEEILDLIMVNLRLAASEELSMATLIKYARYLAFNLRARDDAGDGSDVLLKKQKQKEKMALMLKVIQDIREYESPNLLESVTMNLELSILFEELQYFRQQVFTLRKASRSLGQLLQVEGWLKVEDLARDFPKSHGIQALMFNMLFSHRDEACQNTIVKLQKMLANEKECLQFRENYSVKGSEKDDDLLAGLACELGWRHKSTATQIYEEDQSSNHGPFLFSPKAKNKGRKVLESGGASAVWAVNQLTELSLHLYLRKSGVDLSDHIDIQGMKLLFVNSSNVVMSSFVLVGKEETREGQQVLSIKAKILPLESGEFTLEGVKVPERQTHDGGVKLIHTVRFQNVRSSMNVRVVNSIPLIAGRFCDKNQNTLSQLHLLENERKQFQLELRNSGEIAVKRLEVTWDMESDEGDEQPLFSVKHDNILLKEGQVLDLGCLRVLDITLESGRKAHRGGKVYTRHVRFFVLFSEISKGGSKFLKKTIVSSLTLDISVHIHKGLILQKIFLPEDNMMTSIENQGICMEVSNQSEEVLQICQTLAREDVEFPDNGHHNHSFTCKPLYTTKFMLMPPDEQLESSFLHWRSIYGDRKGRIPLFDAAAAEKETPPNMSYPIWGKIESSSNTNKQSIFAEESASFEVKISSQRSEECDVDFEIKCLCVDGSVVSSGDVILAGVLSFSNISIPPNAKDTQVCKFGAYFLCPGKYSFVLTDKAPKGRFYSNSYIFEVEEKKR